MKFKLVTLSLLVGFGMQYQHASAQIDEGQLGGWYMYFWQTKFGESQFGMQGDVQLRTWNAGNDLQQLLLRSGFTYTPKNTKVLLTLGFGQVTSGEFGESSATSSQTRIYQEALLPQKIGKRVYLKHRFRYEQRWVDGQDFRNRFRYNIFLNIPFNQEDLSEGAIYLALYNELFINGEKEIGNGKTVEYFGLNRFYFALGYSIKDNMKVQAGYMEQTTNSLSKGQIQLSLHHSF